MLVRFGKHKGDLWSEVPERYLRWIVENFSDGEAFRMATALLSDAGDVVIQRAQRKPRKPRKPRVPRQKKTLVR